MNHEDFSIDDLSYKPNGPESLQRLKAFWEREFIDHPPIRIRYPLDGVSDPEWQESCEAADTHFAYWEHMNDQKRELPDDDMLVAAVYHGPAFMGGIMGAPVTFGKGTSWNEHIMKDYGDLDRYRNHPIDSTNAWIALMEEQVAYFTEHARGRFPVGTNLFTGPGDIMADLRGVTEMYLDIALDRENVRKLARICTDAYIKTTQLCFDMIPSLEGGYCDYYSLWTPGRSCMVDDDLTVGLSADDYMDLLFASDDEALESMDTPWMHTHSGQIRLAPEFLKHPGLRGLQVVNDWPAGPKVEDMIPMLKLVQESHCLLLRKFTPEDLELLLPELRCDRLYVDTQCDDLESAKKYLEYWKKRAWS